MDECVSTDADIVISKNHICEEYFEVPLLLRSINGYSGKTAIDKKFNNSNR